MQNTEHPALSGAQPSRPLRIDDLARVARAMREPGQPLALFRAVEAVATETIGFRLITIMAYDAKRHEVARVFTNMPDVYPVGGRKKKQGTPWATRILQELKPFRGESLDDIRKAFDDHKVMQDLGLGSILNIPIAYDGACVGTMNLTHVEHWYTREHEEAGLLLGSFLAAALVEIGAAQAAGNTAEAQASAHRLQEQRS